MVNNYVKYLQFAVFSISANGRGHASMCGIVELSLCRPAQNPDAGRTAW